MLTDFHVIIMDGEFLPKIQDLTTSFCL